MGLRKVTGLMSLSEELVELGFEPGTLVPDPLDAFTTRCSVILTNSESEKGSDVSVSQLNIHEAQRGLVTGAGSLVQALVQALVGFRVTPFDFLGVFSVKTSSLFVQG